MVALRFWFTHTFSLVCCCYVYVYDVVAHAFCYVLFSCSYSFYVILLLLVLPFWLRYVHVHVRFVHIYTHILPFTFSSVHTHLLPVAVYVTFPHAPLPCLPRFGLLTCRLLCPVPQVQFTRARAHVYFTRVHVAPRDFARVRLTCALVPLYTLPCLYAVARYPRCGSALLYRVAVYTFPGSRVALPRALPRDCCTRALRGRTFVAFSYAFCRYCLIVVCRACPSYLPAVLLPVTAVRCVAAVAQFTHPHVWLHILPHLARTFGCCSSLFCCCVWLLVGYTHVYGYVHLPLLLLAVVLLRLLLLPCICVTLVVLRLRRWFDSQFTRNVQLVTLLRCVLVRFLHAFSCAVGYVGYRVGYDVTLPRLRLVAHVCVYYFVYAAAVTVARCWLLLPQLRAALVAPCALLRTLRCCCLLVSGCPAQVCFTRSVALRFAPVAPFTHFS